MLRNRLVRSKFPRYLLHIENVRPKLCGREHYYRYSPVNDSAVQAYICTFDPAGR